MKLGKILILSLLGIFIATPGFTLPQLEQVVSGSAEFNQPDENSLNIATSDKVIINYKSFDILEPEMVRFIQPTSLSCALNRVIGIDPSDILGSLSANGRIFLINPNGIFFGQNSKVDCGSFIASTLNISDEDFLADKLFFKGETGQIINKGLINADEYIAFVSPKILNEGTICVNEGKIDLISGDEIYLDFSGDSLINFAIDKEVKDGLIENKGIISAEGGKILLSTRSVQEVIGSVINNTGVIKANSLIEKEGIIYLVSKAEGAITNYGEIDVSGKSAEGGRISITGEYFGNTGRISADAGEDKDAGSIYINSSKETLIAGGILSANGRGRNSSGGKIRVLSDMKKGLTRILETASLEAKGGDISGDGGFIEVSGNRFSLKGKIDVSAKEGKSGTFLLDPENIYIVLSGSAGENLSDDCPLDYNDSGDPNALTSLPLLFADSGDAAKGATDNTTEDNDLDAPATAEIVDDDIGGEIEAEWLQTLDGNVILQAKNDILIGADTSIANNVVTVTGGVDSGYFFNLDFKGADGTSGNADDADSVVLQAGRHIIFNHANTKIITYGAPIHLEADSPHSPTGAQDGVGTLTIGKLTSNNGDITLIGADITINGSIKAGSGNVNIAHSQGGANPNILLGSPTTEAADDMELTDAEIDAITSTGTVTIGQAQTKGTNGAGENAITLTAQNIIVDDLTPANFSNLILRCSGTINDDTADTGVTIANLRLDSGSGIGTNDTLNLDADNLSAQSTGEGIIDITDSDAITIDTVLGLSGITSSNSNITLTATNGSITINQEVNSGTANLTLTTQESEEATSADLTLAANLTGAALTLTSADAINQTAGAIIATDLTLTAQGAITATQANNDVDNLDASSTVSGNIQFTDIDDITLTRVNTEEGDITISSGGQMIAVNVVAGGSGNISLTTTSGNIYVDNVTADGDRITLVSAGSIDESGVGDPGVDLTSQQLILDSQTGIGSANAVESQVSNLSARVQSAQATGNIQLINTGGLTLLDILGTWGYSINNAGSGNVVITASSPLTISSNVNAVGDITLTADETNDSPTGADDLTINANITSTSGNILLQAGDDIIQATGTTVSTSGGRITLTAAYQDLDSIGGITQSGTAKINSGGGDIALSGLDDIRLTVVDAQANGGAITIRSNFGSILDNNGDLNNLTARTATLYAANIIGRYDDPLDVYIYGGDLYVEAYGVLNLVSVNIWGTVYPSDQLRVLNIPPGLVLFNNRLFGGEKIFQNYLEAISYLNPYLIDISPFFRERYEIIDEESLEEKDTNLSS